MKSYVYLHGFASSPASSKARYFAVRFAERGVTLEVPALDGGDFEHLTISGQLALMERLLKGRAAVLLGSSLGGYLAALYAARHAEVERVVLMAPAFEFGKRFGALVGEASLQGWKARGTLPVYHYGMERQVALGYGLYEDAQQYEAFPDVRQPALILHGVKDEVVPVQLSRQFCDGRPEAKLREFDSGHELTDVVGELWMATETFLWPEAR
jgi:pimeloyl-ACP methyl ester carboxylesterase